jgi:hypothetical protein
MPIVMLRQRLLRRQCQNALRRSKRRRYDELASHSWNMVKFFWKVNSGEICPVSDASKRSVGIRS